MTLKPTVVGDLIELIVTYTPPADNPTGKVTEAVMLTKSPTGSETVTAGIELDDNIWRFIATTRITEPGDWFVRVNANVGLIDSIEFRLPIRPSEFTTPLP